MFYFCKLFQKGFPSAYVVIFFMFNNFRWEVVVHCADINRIVDHHCLNFLFIKLENKKLHISVEQPRKMPYIYYWSVWILLTFDLHLPIPHLKSNLWHYPTNNHFEWQMVNLYTYTCIFQININHILKGNIFQSFHWAILALYNTMSSLSSTMLLSQ